MRPIRGGSKLSYVAVCCLIKKEKEKEQGRRKEEERKYIFYPFYMNGLLVNILCDGCVSPTSSSSLFPLVCFFPFGFVSSPEFSISTCLQSKFIRFLYRRKIGESWNSVKSNLTWLLSVGGRDRSSNYKRRIHPTPPRPIPLPPPLPPPSRRHFTERPETGRELFNKVHNHCSNRDPPRCVRAFGV